MSEDDPGREQFHKVLVLNSSHTPLNITSWRRAMVLLYKGKAQCMEYDGAFINGKFRLPEIIKLNHYVLMPHQSIVLSRKNIYLRDNYTCQYCGKRGMTMTIDHIIPKSRGGKDHWENLVVCCPRCNNRKSDRSLEESGMKLIGTPYRPSSTLYLHMTRLCNIPKSWYNYFFGSN